MKIQSPLNSSPLTTELLKQLFDAEIAFEDATGYSIREAVRLYLPTNNKNNTFQKAAEAMIEHKVFLSIDNNLVWNDDTILGAAAHSYYQLMILQKGFPEDFWMWTLAQHLIDFK